MTTTLLPNEQPLAGATVIVTRPSASAGAHVLTARALGAAVVRLPGVSLRPMEPLAEVAVALRAASAADAWIFTSPAAVRFACAAVPRLQPSARTQVYAIGAGTARALARQAIEARFPQPRHDSEALLALEGLRDPRGLAITIIDAPAGRGLLETSLRERGARVERVHVYRRVAARIDRRHVTALSSAITPWLTLLSSAETFDNLLAALPESLRERWRTQTLIVSSMRLAEHAAAHAFEDVRIARSATTADLLGAACRALERHRL